MASAAEAVSSPSVAEVINIEGLLAPISDDNPAGENLQYSGLHDEIREARRSEDNLEQGHWKRDTKAAEWHRVMSLAIDALTHKTKDLQICAWLDEALVKLHGFTGLRDGLKVMRGLHERFWEPLYPEMDGDDLEARANSLTWIDEKLSLALKELPITKSVTGASYSFLQWKDSTNYDVPEKLDDLDSDELDRINATKRSAAEEGKITSEQWRLAKSGTRRPFYEQTYALLNECWEEFVTLDRVIDEKYERQTPGLGGLKKSLDEVRSAVEKIVKEKRIAEPDSIDPEPAVVAEGETRTPIAASGYGFVTTSGPVRSRQEALRRLAEVADFFRQTEPHSPVSYLVQRAIKWGKMPLESWLQDVIKNDGVLDQLRETLGLNAMPEGNHSSDESET